MRMFRAKKNMNLGFLEDVVIFKGQMFFLDSPTELPHYSDPATEEYKEHWQELELYNNFGSVRLQGKI